MEATINPSDLETFGLSSYEAKVYVTMLPLGQTTAKDISNKSSIPFGRIYDVMSSLEIKGLIDKQDSRPKRYIAKAPKTAMKNLLNYKDQELLVIKETAPLVEEKLSKLYSPSDESPFWSVALEDETIERHNNKILETQEELLIYLNPSNLESHKKEDVQSFLDSLNEIIERKATVKLLFGGISKDSFINKFSTLSIENYKLLQLLEVRLTNIITNTFDVIDKEKVVFKINNPVDEDKYLALIYLYQRPFAIKMRQKFEELWQKANTLDFNF